jgi:hypothetical protein
MTPVVVVARVPQAADGHTRYHLSNGWFIDHERVTGRRSVSSEPFSVWAPGAGPDGIALRLFGGTGLRAVLRRLNDNRGTS